MRPSICKICGAWGHVDKACPVYRLNEQQEALGSRRRDPGEVEAERVQENWRNAKRMEC